MSVSLVQEKKKRQIQPLTKGHLRAHTMSFFFFYLVSDLLFLIVILFMGFCSLGILCRFQRDGMKHNTSGERHVLMNYGPECHHSGDVY